MVNELSPVDKIEAQSCSISTFVTLVTRRVHVHCVGCLHTFFDRPLLLKHMASSASHRPHFWTEAASVLLL